MAKKKDKVLFDANEILENMEKTGEVIKEETEELLDGVLNDVQSVVIKDKSEEVEQEQVPKIGSQIWTSYVLNKLNPDETYSGCPTYEGLRRICYDLLGTIVDVDIDVKQTPNIQNSNHSCVVAKLTIEHPVHYTWLGDIAGRTIRYSHVGDVFHGNGNQDQFAWRFSSSTCWTRTKAALLRDAFRLKHTFAAEEMSSLANDDDGSTGYANSTQFDGLDTIFARTNINAEKFLIGVWRQARPKDTPHKDLNLLPFHVAAMSFGLLVPLQAKKDTIKPEIIGYNKSWKDGIKCLK